MTRTHIRACTVGDRRRSALEASLRRWVDAAAEGQTLPAPPVGGEIVKPR